jgi:SAM-dependent methyltransferase
VQSRAVSQPRIPVDIWGRIYLDHWRGGRHAHTFVRDDGEQNVVEDASGYFQAPRWSAEQAVCESLSGRVLDLGCGPGSYSVFLEERGVDVVAVDSSPGAIRVCRARGCRYARVMDFTQPTLDGQLFDALICMGNTVGINQSPRTLAPFSRHRHISWTGYTPRQR